MQIIIYIVSALITNYLFSAMTIGLVVFGIEKVGGDPGSPGIMLVSLLCINIILSIITATAMGVAKGKYNKEFPAKYSALIFLFTYIPFHIVGIYFPEEKIGVLAIPLAIICVIMLYFSYIPFMHMCTQGLTNLYEFVKKQEKAGNRYVKYVVSVSLISIIILSGWLIFKPETQSSTGVLSLEENWLLLESGGEVWQPDAYLQQIVFYPNSRLPYEIAATYLSQSTPEQMYTIEFDNKSRIYDTEIRDSYNMRDSAKLPIRLYDWHIDSVQAWDLYQQIESINACVTPSENTAFFSMHLHRIDSGRVVWDLYVSGCSTLPNSYGYYLDAKTGEDIDSYFD
jgi:hypothetical protein